VPSFSSECIEGFIGLSGGQLDAVPLPNGLDLEETKPHKVKTKVC
jgi:hypothetical protein